MPALALISTNSTLYERLTSALEGAAWSVEWFAPDQASESVQQQDVIVIDGSDSAALDWAAPHGKPALMVIDELAPEGSEQLADDIVFLPLRGDELITRLERLLARSPLENLRQRYAKTFASMALGIVVIGPDYRMVFANPRSYEIVGHRKETISADDIGRLIAPEDLPRIKDVLAHGQHPRGMDVHLVRRDGTQIVCNCSFAPLIGAEDHTVISFEDVTDQRETEKELLKTMEFLESLIDASVDAIVATDMEHRVVLFNPERGKDLRPARVRCARTLDVGGPPRPRVDGAGDTEVACTDPRRRGAARTDDARLARRVR